MTDEPRTSSRLGRWFGWPAAIVVLALYLTLAISSVTGKSPTFDETTHLTTGLSYWLENDYRLNPEGGTLAQRWVALPVLASGVEFPTTDQSAWHESRQWTLGHQLFYESENDREQLLLLGRSFAALLGVATLLAIYVWSRRLFGPAGGLLSLTLAAFDPNLLAHGRLMTADVAVTLMMLLSVGGLWCVMRRVSWATLVGSCVALGVLLLAKFSAVLIVPMAGLMVLTRLIGGGSLELALGKRAIEIRGRLRVGAALALLAVVHAVAATVIVWGGYGFRYSAFATFEPDRDRFGVTWETLEERDGRAMGPIDFARENHLLPEAYLLGLAFVTDNTARTGSFLNGEYLETGQWTFFPYAVLVKTPLGLFVVLGLALAGVIPRWRGPPDAEPRAGLSATTPLWILLGVYWAFALTTKLNIGLRHVLPAAPAVFILAGAAATWLARPRRAGAAVALVAMILAIGAVAISSICSWPHYLAFFNPLVGPRHGYKHLVDSSLDWGQDLDGLGRWLARRNLDEPDASVYLAYFGSADPPHHGIHVRRLPSFFDWRSGAERDFFPLEPGTYCISATLLQGMYHDPHPPWTDELERRYQAQRSLIEPAFRPGTARARFFTDPGWRRGYFALDDMRLSRLCVFLRDREPDDAIGYSILVYELDADDLRAALE